MKLDQTPDKMIYLQLVDWILDNILLDVFREGEQIPSVTELSVTFQINHLTALKGIGILTDEGILYKKRGIGMFVSEGAKEKIHQHRKNAFMESYVQKTIEEAGKLGITKEELISMIEGGYKNE